MDMNNEGYFVNVQVSKDLAYFSNIVVFELEEIRIWEIRVIGPRWSIRCSARHEYQLELIQYILSLEDWPSCQQLSKHASLYREIVVSIHHQHTSSAYRNCNDENIPDPPHIDFGAILGRPKQELRGLVPDRGYFFRQNFLRVTLGLAKVG